MTELSDIKAAAELVDVADDSKWEKDGTPKVDAVKEHLDKNAKVSGADVLKAIGDFRRPTPPAAPAAPKVEVTALEKQEEPAPSNPMDSLLAQVEAARAKRDEITLQMAEQRSRRDTAARALVDLSNEQNRHILFIEKNEPRVSQAEAVKRIQAQTTERLAATKVHASTVAQIMGAVAGSVPGAGGAIFPSKLDAALASRPKHPDHLKNQAAYIQQSADARNAARG